MILLCAADAKELNHFKTLHSAEKIVFICSKHLIVVCVLLN